MDLSGVWKYLENFLDYAEKNQDLFTQEQKDALNAVRNFWTKKKEDGTPANEVLKYHDVLDRYPKNSPVHEEASLSIYFKAVRLYNKNREKDLFSNFPEDAIDAIVMDIRSDNVEPLEPERFMEMSKEEKISYLKTQLAFIEENLSVYPKELYDITGPREVTREELESVFDDIVKQYKGNIEGQIESLQ